MFSNKTHLKNVFDCFHVTVDKIYSNICEICEMYFSCKKYDVNVKSKSPAQFVCEWFLLFSFGLLAVWSHLQLIILQPTRLHVLGPTFQTPPDRWISLCKKRQPELTLWTNTCVNYLAKSCSPCFTSDHQSWAWTRSASQHSWPWALEPEHHLHSQTPRKHRSRQPQPVFVLFSINSLVFKTSTLVCVWVLESLDPGSTPGPGPPAVRHSPSYPVSCHTLQLPCQ